MEKTVTPEEVSYRAQMAGKRKSGVFATYPQLSGFRHFIGECAAIALLI
jgi:hypothetical protein